ADGDSLLPQRADDPWSTVTLPSLRMKGRDTCVQRGIGPHPWARCSSPPLQIAAARHRQLPAHPRHLVVVAMSFDPGVFHRDSFAKYAAAFFTISRSNLALASSRRSRLFSASSSAGEPLSGPARGRSPSLPLRFNRIQFPRLERIDSCFLLPKQ